MSVRVLTIAENLIKLTQGHSVPVANDNPMSRIVRDLLFASVIACHAVVTLCGPCLHALPGSSHELGAATKSQRSGDPVQPRRDAADNCLLCQFVAQGQLLAESSTGVSNQPVAELVVPVLEATYPPPVHLPSSARAPPLARATWS
jgi:hypothetical protein